MRIFFLAVLLSVTSLSYAASYKLAESRIREIEDYKAEIADSKHNPLFSSEENLHLANLYSQLEKDEYTISTRDGSLAYSVDEYDIEETLWPVKISAELFDGNIKINHEIDLLYSNMMERQYLNVDKMTEYQRRDYEYYVTSYENKFKAGEEQIHIELTFKIQHWNKASQYRFKPVKITVWKIAKKDRIILTQEDMNAETWISEPAIDVRTKKEIDADNTRTKTILYGETRTANKKDEPKEMNYEKKRGRRAIVLSLSNWEEQLNTQELTSGIPLSSFDASLTFGFGNIAFGGLEISFDLTDREKKSAYAFGGIVGASIEFANLLRPYVAGGIAARTDDRIVMKVGAGMDVKMSHLLLNFAYFYNWNNTIGNSSDRPEEDGGNRRYHSLSAGIGFTW